MPYEFDEMSQRARKRDAHEIHKKIQQKRAKRLRLVTLCAILAVCLLVLILVVTRHDDPSASTSESTSQSTAAPTQPTTEPTTLPTDPTQPTDPETVIRLVFGGDLNITDQVVAAGENGGNYDYTALLMDIAPILSDAEATFLNLEGSICGVPYGTGSASGPQELAEALASAGVDFVQLANSYSIFNGLTGLSATANSIRAAGMIPTGVFLSETEQAESNGFQLVNIGGIRVAIVAFTKGMDGMSLPAGSENCLNLLYTDYATTYQTVAEEHIRTVLQAVAAQEPDLTIALVHWGSEYNDAISPTQQAIAAMMLESGVDAIVGTHSHYVQSIDYDSSAGTVVAWSLGDFLSSGEKAGTNYSVLLQLEITRDNRTGETKISACDYTGMYLLTPDRDGEPMRLVRIENAMAMYENNHIGKVSAQAYENIRYARQRILSRVDSKS